MDKSEKNIKGRLIGTVVMGSTLQLLYSPLTEDSKNSSTHVISCKTNSEARALEALHRQTWGLAPVKHQPVGHICGQIYPIPESWKTMKIKNDLKARFGNQPAKELAGRIGDPQLGDPTVSPANYDKILASMTAFAVGEALGAPLEGRSRNWITRHIGNVTDFVVPKPQTDTDTQLMLITADSVLADLQDHPNQFALRLRGAALNTHGVAVRRAQRNLIANKPWWAAADPDSAGTSAAARSIAFGLIWSGNPERAAYEAALSASVTHGHAMGVTGAAAMAAAVSLASDGRTTLDAMWLEAIARVCESYAPIEVHGTTLFDRIKVLPSLLGQTDKTVLTMLGTGPLAGEAVLAALWCATRQPNGGDGILTAVNAGGDTDTIAAMAGACLGACYGLNVIPVDSNRVVNIGEIEVSAKRIAAVSKKTSKQAAADEKSKGAENVHASFLIDRSGSMSGVVGDVIGGYNQFVENQRNIQTTGECAFTAVQFDSDEPFKVMHDGTPIGSVPAMTSFDYQPRGLTPLFDALGNLIKTIEKRIATSIVPEDQIVVVFTDGMENASNEWTREAVFKLVTEKENEGWTFNFMGANQDSYETGRGLGFKHENTSNFRADGRGTKAAFDGVDRAMSEYRRLTPSQKMVRKGNFFNDIKEAEEDMRNR